MRNDEQNEKKLDDAKTSGIIRGMRQGRRDNHTGTLMQRHKGGNIIARWMVDGKMHYLNTHTNDPKAARAILNEQTAAYAEDSTKDEITMLEARLAVLRGRQARTIPLAEIWAHFEKKIPAGTKQQSRKNYETGVGGLVEHMKRRGCRIMGDITEDMAEDYLIELRNHTSVETRNCRLSLFKRVWRELSNGDEGPWAKKKGLKRGQEDGDEITRRALTQEEVDRLVALADDDMRLMVILSVTTGLREVDCAHLKWACVDFENRALVDVRQEKTGGLVTVAMHPALERELLKARETCDGSAYVNPRNAEAYDSGSLDREASKLFKRADIKTFERDAKKRLHKTTGFHALRRTYATMRAENGASLESIQRTLGHTSTRMTAHYLDKESLEAQRRSVEGIRINGAA